MEKEYRARLEVIARNDGKMDMSMNGNCNDLVNMAVALLAQVMVDSSKSWDEIKQDMPEVVDGLMAVLKDYWDEKTAQKSAAAGAATDAAQNVMQEA